MRTRSRSHRHVTFRLACRCTPLRFFSARVRLVFVPGLPRRRETRRQTSRTRPTPRLFVLCHLGLVFQEQHPVAVQFVWSSTTAFPSAHGTTCGHHRCCCNRGRPTDLKPLSGVRFRTRANEVRSPLWPKRIASCTRGAARSRLYAALARDGCFCCGTHDSLLVRATITEPRRPNQKASLRATIRSLTHRSCPRTSVANAWVSSLENWAVLKGMTLTINGFELQTTSVTHDEQQASFLTVCRRMGPKRHTVSTLTGVTVNRAPCVV